MTRTVKFGMAILLIVIGAVLLFNQNSKSKKAISVNDASELVNDTSVVILDVRTPAEYSGELGHIDHVLLIPVQELKERIGELEQYKGKTILAVCRTGRRSAAATEILAGNGFTVKNVEGGMVKWNEEKLPVVKETK